MPAPSAIAEPGWITAQPFPSATPRETFLRSADDDERVRIAYFRKPDAGTLYVRAWFGPRALGPPGHVHGGAMAAVLDEAMGAACWMNGHSVVAAQISISFLGMLPIGTETTVEAWIDKIDGRKVHLRAHMKNPSGQIVSEGRGLFVVLKDETLKSLNGLR
jgi:acyl-coenzyme A thioesterase PaaI-like protein